MNSAQRQRQRLHLPHRDEPRIITPQQAQQPVNAVPALVGLASAFKAGSVGIVAQMQLGPYQVAVPGWVDVVTAEKIGNGILEAARKAAGKFTPEELEEMRNKHEHTPPNILIPDGIAENQQDYHFPVVAEAVADSPIDDLPGEESSPPRADAAPRDMIPAGCAAEALPHRKQNHPG